MESTLSNIPLLYTAIDETATLILEPSLAWVLLLMVVVVAGGLLWLLQREYRANRPDRHPLGRGPIRHGSRVMPKGAWRAWSGSRP
ncbi:hypothetical protein HRbin30_01546 [bacterium HR30]|nr:hypothetical protein HRbin30_01546 [bacterium HR30]